MLSSLKSFALSCCKAHRPQLWAVPFILALAACQQTPVMDPTRSSERAAYSEWWCDGEAMLAQFYGARVVVSDVTSSRWLDRGTQVGQVFRGGGHSIRFRDDKAQWIRESDEVECHRRELPAAWQQQQKRNALHFVAQGQSPDWSFKLHGNQLTIEVAEPGEPTQQRRLPAGDADYYLDMWTYNVQTANDRMRVQITDGLCRDPVDSTPYPSSIQINWNDQVFRGCGRWLAKSDYRP